ncbi:TetR/AcrR family transcriptional regulator [Nodularia spumigena]|uniref:TetR/AcrR family transcriptional regulator n=1 Tax=Nodularia spumigena TaxID=70799 RepID=UPI002B20B9DF|nr:TetR/AcrR family transcriptional regulator [Nodularia spumigena]MEA5558064.1 TetR/AcrR family transcriptional regulator [Nodularia spumigena CH309]
MTSKGDRARQDFLEVGVEMLAGAGLADFLAEAITIDGLCERTGRSTGGFYHHWPSKADYFADLVFFAIDRGNEQFATRLGNDLALIAEADSPPQMLGLLQRFLSSYIGAALDDPHGASAEMLVWMADEEELTAGLRDRYALLGELGAAALDAVLRSWGREILPPWTARTLGDVISALVFGVQFGQRIRPEAFPPHLFVETATALVATVTRPLESDIDLEGYFRLSLSAGRGRSDSAWAERIRSATAPLIVDAYIRGGWHAVSLVSIAEAADEYVEDVEAAWGGRAGLSTAIWREHLVGPLEHAATGDMAADPSGSTRPLERHLQRLVRTVEQHRPVSAALLAVLTGLDHRSATYAPTSLPPTGLVEIARRVLAHARANEAGTGNGVDPASALTHLLLTQCVTRPDLAPFEVAESVFAFVTLGMCEATPVQD